jgi:hypothetical protein
MSPAPPGSARGEGYQVERLPDGELQFRRPTGLVLPNLPAPPSVPDDPARALRAVNDAHGIQLTPRSLKPLWYGERLDLGYAIDVLHPRARKKR